jgi:hypothetical protein
MAKPREREWKPIARPEEWPARAQTATVFDGCSPGRFAMAPIYRNPFIVYSSEANIHLFGQPGETVIFWADVEFLTSRPYSLEDLEEVGQPDIGVDSGVFTYWPAPPPPVYVNLTFTDAYDTDFDLSSGSFRNLMNRYTLIDAYDTDFDLSSGSFKNVMNRYTLVDEYDTDFDLADGVFDLQAVRISYPEELDTDFDLDSGSLTLG